MSYYPRIKELREDHDYTQTLVANKLIITQQQYSLYEKGYRDIPVSMLAILAEMYNTSVDYIIGLTNNPTPYRK